MRTFAALISLALACIAPAQEAEQEAPVVPEFHVTQIEKIRAARGTEVRVYGKVTRTNKSNNTGTNFLSFESKDFTVVTFGKDLKAFANGEPADVYKDKFVEVTGVIEFYKDDPQIVLKSPDQIREIPEKAPPKDETEPKPDAEPDQPDPPEKEIPKTVDPRKYFSD